MAGDPNPARLFLRQGGTATIRSSDVVYTVTIELGGPTRRLQDPIAWALRWHMMGKGLLDHLRAVDSWSIAAVTKGDNSRATLLDFSCKAESVAAVRQLAADAVKAVVGGSK